MGASTSTPSDTAQSDSPQAAAAPQHQASASRPESEGEASQQESNCPICAFIEAGPCKAEHQVWVKCRDAAKARGEDYVEVCQDTFKSFLQCALTHDEYYEPFLEMLSLSSHEDSPDKETEPALNYTAAQ